MTFAPVLPEPVLHLCKKLHESGKRAWVVGGSVRDLLMGKPVSDYDIATDARPAEVSKIFPKVIPTGIEHGTVSVLIKGVPYEVTTLRGETSYSDGRHPDGVVFLDDIQGDLARRDFTLNAIAYDPLDGKLIDPFGGQKDLDAKIIRAVGDPNDRFGEDGLRVLRAARFVATLDATLDPATEAAIGRTLDTYRKVSAERVRDEWVKTMKAKQPSRAFDVMRRTGILGVSCPELMESVGCEQNKHHAYDVWGHAMACLDACNGGAMLRMAALLHDVGKPRTRAIGEKTKDYTFYDHERVGGEMSQIILNRLKFSNQERERIVALVRHHLVCYDDGWSDGAVRRWMRRVGTETLEDLYELCRADARGKGLPDESREDIARIDRLEIRAKAVIEAGNALTVRDLAIDGNVLMHELHVKPGRGLGQMLEALLEAVMEDPSLNEREALLAKAKSLQLG